MELRDRVTVTDMEAKMKNVEYHILPGTTMTICQITMENGYVVLGSSACVDPENFNEALGEKYSYEDAVSELWSLEGYLLAQERFLATK